MVFVVKKISNYGTSHAVVARLQVQTRELLQWADLSKDDADKVAAAYFDMANRLLKCHEAHDRLLIALRSAEEQFQPTSDPRIVHGPHVVGLTSEVETFLYESKNFLRDLLGAPRVFSGSTFDEASAFSDAKGKGQGKFVEWASARFGATDPFTTMLVTEQVWVGELVRKRNAVEHPGKRSGTLHICNFQRLPDGKFLRPSWHRDQEPPTDIFADLQVGLDNLLTLAEDMLVSCIVHKTKFRVIRFVEIPENNRNALCPIRITVALDHDALKPPVAEAT